jgi:hypothetical protein
MGVKSVAFAILPLALALSGCSGVSAEEESALKIKLIEYENCLSIQTDYWKKLNENFQPQVVEKLALERCAGKRP